MGVIGKLEVEIDIKSRGDVFHELIVSKPHDVSTIIPHLIHGFDLHDGELGKVGSIVQWEYNIDGKKLIARHLIEAIDEEKKMARFKLIEGSTMLEEYKNVTLSLHVISKGDIDAVIWDIEFEWFDDIGPYPCKAIDFMIKFTKDIEAHHVNA